MDIEKHKLECLDCRNIIYSNDCLINDQTLIIFLTTKIIFIDLSEMKMIKNIDFAFNEYMCLLYYNYNFYNSDKDNKILFYYYNNLRLKKEIIDLDKKISKINGHSDISNFNNNFYDKYQKNISKYINILDFSENLIEENMINKKKYMDIPEIVQYFSKVKKIDIFSRKDFINNIIEGATLNDEYHKILKTTNFDEIKKYSKLFETQDSKQRKNNMIKIMLTNVGHDNTKINSLYLQIIKLLILDNSNVKLIEIYLIFLSLYKNDLEINFQGKIESYIDEAKYYYPCFSKKDYKNLFDLQKDSEKKIVFNFLKKACEIKKYVYNDSDLKKLVKRAKKILKKLPDFNQPIELDNQNKELKWFKIKVNIAETFGSLKLNIDEQEKLGRLKNGVRTIIGKKLLKKVKIINDKDKLDCALILVINPCKSLRDSEFVSNSLLSKTLNKEDLSKYQNDFKSPKNLCVKNLDKRYEDYNLEEKYNFKYLIDNYVSNQKEIRKFLKNILVKKVFIEAYKILFGNDDEYKLLNKRYLNELIDNRLKFAPIRPYGAAALSDKMSLNTFIVAINRTIIGNEISKKMKLILETGCYVSIEEHEIFHLLGSLPHYENNCSLSIKTPRKKNYKGEAEDGLYLEYLLFNRELKDINLGEILYILNEENYEKSLNDFRIGFQKLDKKDLKIKGIFSEYNNFINLKIIKVSTLKNTIINKISDNNLLSIRIRYELKNDVIGNKPYNL